MKVFPITKRKDNNPDIKEDRKRLNDLFIKARKPKPDYFNKLGNELKNKGKVSRVFDLTKKYIAGVLTITEIKLALKKKKVTPPKKKFRKPRAWIVRKK